MSEETPKSHGRQNETRNDLLQAPNLWEFFCERTSEDARNWFKETSNPPPLSLLIGTTLATIFCLALQSDLWLLFLALTVALLIWIILIKSASSRNDINEILLNIARGEFPPPLRESIVKRLRWWNSLIAPHEWGSGNSRIYDIQNRLEIRMHDLQAEMVYWESDEGLEKRNEMDRKWNDSMERKREQQQKLKMLQSRGVNVTGLEEENTEALAQCERVDDPETLSRMMRNDTQRDLQMTRIRRIRDPLLRSSEELVFVKALSLKSHKITELLDGLEELEPPLEKLDADNADRIIQDSINILERRRALVLKINRVPMKQVMKLLSYNTNFASGGEDDEQNAVL